MKDFFVPKDLLLFSNSMGMNSDFSVRGFSGGISEAMGTLTVTVISGAAVLWTPAEIATAQWFDADDESTITLNGAAVSQWADKSGNTRHAAQATPTAQPALVASGRNGRDIVVFDGTSDTLPHGFALTSNICSLFAVASVGAQAGYRGIYTTNGANATNIMMLARGGTSNWGTYYSNAYRQANTNIQGAGWQILEMLRGGISGAYMRNGSADGSFSGSEGQNGAIGGNATGSQFCDLSVAEIILLQTNPDETTRQKIEGYLAHKWGLTANLLSGHPYKSAPPTI